MKRKIVLGVVLTVVVIITVIALLMYHKPHTVIATEKAAYKLSASELGEAFSKDEGLANALYAGKVLEVTGTLKEIIMNDNTPILMMGEPSGMTSVSCYLQRENKDKARTLKTGTQITVKGVCNGFLVDVVLDKCILLQSGE